jgi:poly-D-alanine transfer protein DltD
MNEDEILATQLVAQVREKLITKLAKEIPEDLTKTFTKEIKRLETKARTRESQRDKWQTKANYFKCELVAARKKLEELESLVSRLLSGAPSTPTTKGPQPP